MVGGRGLDPSPKSPQVGVGGESWDHGWGPTGHLGGAWAPEMVREGSVGRVSACSGWAWRGPGAGSPPLETLSDS